MTTGEPSRDQETTVLANRQAVAQASLRALRAGEVVIDHPYRHLVGCS